MSEGIRLGSEVREPKVFIYGNWSVGELRLTIDELGKYASGSAYSTDISEPKSCTSCRSNKQPEDIDILLLENENMPICKSCRGKLDSKIKEVVEDNSLLVFSETI